MRLCYVDPRGHPCLVMRIWARVRAARFRVREGRLVRVFYHPPLLVKILMVAAAFWLFHPLGVTLLVIVLWWAARRHGGYAFRGAKVGQPLRRTRAAFRNAAFEERQRETLKALEEDAEAFERKQREARNRQAFERFMSDRGVANGGPGQN